MDTSRPDDPHQEPGELPSPEDDQDSEPGLVDADAHPDAAAAQALFGENNGADEQSPDVTQVVAGTGWFTEQPPVPPQPPAPAPSTGPPGAPPPHPPGTAPPRPPGTAPPHPLGTASSPAAAPHWPFAGPQPGPQPRPQPGPQPSPQPEPQPEPQPGPQPGSPADEPRRPHWEPPHVPPAPPRGPTQAGLGSGQRRLPPPPPPEHAQPPGRVPAQYRPPPPGRSYAGFIAPPPRHGPQPGAFSAAPPHYGYPLNEGRPVPYGQVPPVGAHLAGSERRRAEVGPVLPAQHAGAPGGAPAQHQDQHQHQGRDQHQGREQDDEELGRDQEPDSPSLLTRGLPSQVPGPLAGFGARSVSFLIDTVVPWLLLGVLIFVGAAAGILVLSLVLFAFGYLGLFAFTTWNSCYRQGTTGQSIGRRVAGTRLVKIETGEPVGFAVALLRHVCHMVEFGIGLLWPLWDEQRQTFADKLVGTVVVRIEGPDEIRGPQQPAPAEP